MVKYFGEKTGRKKERMLKKQMSAQDGGGKRGSTFLFLFEKKLFLAFWIYTLSTSLLLNAPGSNSGIKGKTEIPCGGKDRISASQSI